MPINLGNAPCIFSFFPSMEEETQYKHYQKHWTTCIKSTIHCSKKTKKRQWAFTHPRHTKMPQTKSARLSDPYWNVFHEIRKNESVRWKVRKEMTDRKEEKTKMKSDRKGEISRISTLNFHKVGILSIYRIPCDFPSKDIVSMDHFHIL